MLSVTVYRHEGGGRHHLGILGTDGVDRVGVSAQLQGRAQRQPLRADTKRYVRRRLHGQLKPLVVRQLGQPGGQGFIGRRVLCLQEVHEGLRDLVKERRDVPAPFCKEAVDERFQVRRADQRLTQGEALMDEAPDVVAQQRGVDIDTARLRACRSRCDAGLPKIVRPVSLHAGETGG